MLKLDPTARKLLSIQKAIFRNAADQEVFVGLNRDESERYIELWGEVTDELIDLDRKHKRAWSGIEDL